MADRATEGASGNDLKYPLPVRYSTYHTLRFDK